MDRTTIIKLTGNKPGKTLTIMGGVHGNEICGVQALDKLRDELKIEAGELYLIYGNPRAIEANQRQTEMNLNRAFRPSEEMQDWEKRTYERARAIEIMPYLAASHALLDVHSSKTEKSTPFIICEPKSFHFARLLPFPIRSNGWDKIEPGGTDYFVNRCGGFGICVECGHHLDPEAPIRAEIAIKTFLTIFGAKTGSCPTEHPNQREIFVHHIHHTKVNFTPVRKFSDFEPLQENELIGHDGDTEIRSPAGNLLIIFCNKKDIPNEEAFILGKKMQ